MGCLAQHKTSHRSFSDSPFHASVQCYQLLELISHYKQDQSNCGAFSNQREVSPLTIVGKGVVRIAKSNSRTAGPMEKAKRWYVTTKIKFQNHFFAIDIYQKIVTFL